MLNNNVFFSSQTKILIDFVFCLLLHFKSHMVRNSESYDFGVILCFKNVQLVFQDNTPKKNPVFQNTHRS